MRFPIFFLLLIDFTSSFAQESGADLRHTIQITLLSRYKRTPFANETVQLFTRKKHKLVEELKTDQGGTVQFTKLKKGDYTVRMTASDGTVFEHGYTVPSRYQRINEYVLGLSTEQKLKLMGSFVLNGDSLRRVHHVDSLFKSGKGSYSDDPDLLTFRKELSSNLEYPARCIEDGIEGRIKIVFFTNETGEILNAGVAIPAHNDLDVEGLFALFLIGKFKSSTYESKERNVFIIPLTFRMS